MRVLGSVGVWAGGMVLMGSIAAWAQQQQPCATPPCSTTGSQRQTPLPLQQDQQLSPNVPPDLTPSPKLEEDQAKMRNLERQKQLVLDTQKLLALANQLKADVDKSSKDTMSLDVIRKADEIEKLAHSVKEKMKGS